ncbi:hypothetical protein WK80_29065 [Burkholderia multivorans]|uniref:hypothetical protein n=1 Tax=Burkholderia multivorans TaxID=87883 RepID=UPI00075E6676|nr:hypothetical protein [Burkholderia multivorans]KVV17828.1 hypothetical protein WK80_29065 [Burkholderia multivorans]MBU9205625.1 hypothetical protein [Burkholderia multivorans]MCA8389805.1 hypothetical protein [Burkholderia multivorans]MCO8319046.1 hypothetical protein [Burkholderia multivorans]MCO8355006.1 hypothetical protein [Burkholderia multivorans]
MKRTMTTIAFSVACATITGCAANGADTMQAQTPASPPAAGHACKADAAPDDALIGKTEADAAALLEGCLWRVIERDGKSLPGTMDYRPERRDLAIRDGKVVGVRRG